MSKWGFLLCLQFIVVLSFGAEVDHFTNRYTEIKDSKEIINQKISLYLADVVYKHNKKNDICRQDQLIAGLRNVFNNHLKKAHFMEFLFESTSLDIKSVKKVNSIYKDWSFFNGAIINLQKDKIDSLVIFPLLKVGSVEVGFDKFEHLFGSGFKFFSEYYIDKKPMVEILKTNIKRERGFLGGSWYATGVFSFGDLVANFNGIRFWNDILGFGADILDQTVKPVISCLDGKYVKVNDLDISRYFDFGVDERVNCSQFATKSATIKINKLGFSKLCSNSSFEFLKLDRKYKQYSKYLLNKWGHVQVEFDEYFDNYGRISTSLRKKIRKEKFKKIRKNISRRMRL